MSGAKRAGLDDEVADRAATDLTADQRETRLAVSTGDSPKRRR